MAVSTNRAYTNSTGTHLGVLVLSEVLVAALELLGDLVALRGAAVFDDGLDDTASVVLKDDVLDTAAKNIHQRSYVLGALCPREVLLAGERPGALRLGEEFAVRLGRFALREQGFLCFVRLPCGCAVWCSVYV